MVRVSYTSGGGGEHSLVSFLLIKKNIYHPVEYRVKISNGLVSMLK